MKQLNSEYFPAGLGGSGGVPGIPGNFRCHSNSADRTSRWNREIRCCIILLSASVMSCVPSAGGKYSSKASGILEEGLNFEAWGE